MPSARISGRGKCSRPILKWWSDRSVWAELEAAAGDEGARGVLARHPRWRSVVEVGGTPPADIDTEEGYAAALRRFEIQSP